MKKGAAVAITLALCVSLLALPSGLSAKGRRGAEIIITRLDGTQVSGELIAVKPDSLLLLSGGRDVSIGLADIRTVVILRKSRSGLLAGIGGAAGAAAGATVGAYVFNKGWDDEPSSLRNGLVFGAAGALAGLLANAILTHEPRFDIAGKPEADVARFWERLSAHSREGFLPKAATAPALRAEPTRVTERPAKVAERPPDRPAAAAASAGSESSGRRKGRFRLSVSASLPASIAEIAPDELNGVGSFYFPNETGPEAGPYAAGVSRRSSSGPIIIRLGPVGLAYDWAPHWSVDAELFTRGRSSCGWDGYLGFTSSSDGQTYATFFYHGYKARFTSLLLGLSYHPLLRDSLQPHDIEIGAAAGPVWVSGTPFGSDLAGPLKLPSFGKIGIAGRVQAAYDYYFVPALSLGFLAEYRFMERHLAGAMASGTTGFWNTEDPTQTRVFQRQMEVTLPTQSLKGGGPYFGLRIGVRI
jgi:hypothetical protein